MAEQANNRQQFLLPAPVVRQPAKRRFRWRLILLPAVVCFVLVWLMSGMEVSFSFEDLMNHLDVQNQERYSRLAAWGVMLVCFVAIVRYVTMKTED